MRYEEERTPWESMKLVVYVAMAIAVGLAVLCLVIYLLGLFGALLFWIHPIVGYIYMGILGLLLFSAIILSLADTL